MVFPLRCEMLVIGILLSFFVCDVTHAESLQLKPERAVGRGVIDALASSTAAAKTVVEGRGDRVRVTYDAESTLLLYILPLQGTAQTGDFSYRDLLVVSLPAGQGMDVDVDVTVGGSWTPRHRRYLLTIFNAADTVVTVKTLSLSP